ncbi:hypothetical protein [Nocardia sp. CNY236]|uniref:hypothetical protein n=1 Tax=Nocardia sp. CNY236 TaxID=1169152 RepID=UPI00048E669D|nr:hypothetical protein [Nocardia sp. CNY236]
MRRISRAHPIRRIWARLAVKRRVGLGYMLAPADPARRHRTEQRLRSLARKHDVKLARVVVIGPTMDRPLGRLLDAIGTLHAAATAQGRPKPAVLVITPDLDHIDKHPAPICEVADLLTARPERLWIRGRTHGQAVPVDL